jgi:hypothetical protein
MKKLIDIWFDAESYTIKLTKLISYEYVITVFKYIKTILQLLLCAIIFSFLFVFELILFGIDKISTLKLRKPKVEPEIDIKPMVPEYNKHGIPKDVGRRDGPITEKDYENMRKVL